MKAEFEDSPIVSEWNLNVTESLTVLEYNVWIARHLYVKNIVLIVI